MTFSMSYQRKPEAAARTKEQSSKGPAQAEAKAQVAPEKPARTGRAGRPNSPHARAEALFRKPAPAADE